MWCCWYSSKWRFAKTAKTRGVSAPFHYAYRHWCGRTTLIIRSITCRGIGAAKETGMNRHHSFFLCLHGSRHSIFNLLFSCDLVGAAMFAFFLLVLSRFFAKNGWQRRKKRLQSRQLNSHPCGADTIRKGSLTESGGRCNRRRWNCVITTVTRDTSACTQQVNKADDNLSSIKVEPRKWFFRPYVRVIYARRKDVFFCGDVS